MAALSNSITAAIPVYNGEEVIGRAIRSIQNQIKIFVTEILVVDDGSQDATCEIVEHLILQDPRIRLVKHTKNQGRAAARNTALDHASGELMAWLDADDEWSPEKLSLQVPFLLSQTDKTRDAKLIIYGSYETRLQRSGVLKTNKAKKQFEIMDLLRLEGRGRDFVYPLTQTFVARTRVLRSFRYDDRLNWSEDTDYLLQFFAVDGQLLNASGDHSVLTYHRSLNGKASTMEQGIGLFFEKHSSTFGSYGLNAKRQHAERLYTMVANAYLSDNNLSGYLRSRLRAVLMAPRVFAPRLAREAAVWIWRKVRP